MTGLTREDREHVNALIGSLVADALGSDVVIFLSVNATQVALTGASILAATTQFHDLTGDIPAQVMPELLRQLADSLEERDRDRHD